MFEVRKNKNYPEYLVNPARSVAPVDGSRSNIYFKFASPGLIRCASFLLNI